MTRHKILSRVLEVKEFTTEQLEAEVKKARERLDHEQAALDGFEQQHRTTCGEFTDRQAQGRLPVREMELYYVYLKHLGKQIEQQKRIVQIRREDVDVRQQALVEAYKEQRLVGKLQDRIAGHEARQAGQAEQKEQDYAFISRRGAQ